MHAPMTAETRPRNLAELIADQRPKSLPGFETDEFLEIVKELFEERAAIGKFDGNLTRNQAEAQAASDIALMMRLIRLTMERIAAETTPWHAREWFLEAYEDHQEFEDDDADDETNC